MNVRDRTIAAALIIAALASAAFIAAYVALPNRALEGLTLAIAASAFAAAAAGWAFWVLPPAQVIDQHDDYPSQRADRTRETEELRETQRELTRRGILNRFLYAALGLFGVALVVPVASLGPSPGDSLFHTKWRRGSRLAREDGSLVRVSDLNVDSIVTVFPEHAVPDAQSQTVLIRLPDGAANSAHGYVAYSKVCTHAGCPVALYRASAKQLLCPCHQSVFDVMRDGAVISGPADHPLPRLPIDVDGDGFIRANDDFPGPVGPGFWSAR